MKIPRLANPPNQRAHTNDHNHRGAEEVTTAAEARNATSTSASSALSKNIATVSKKATKEPISFENLSMKDFKLIKDLGSGSYGVVSLVNLHDNLFALK